MTMLCARPIKFAIIQVLVAKLNHPDARFDQARHQLVQTRPRTSPPSHQHAQADSLKSVSARPTYVDRLFQCVQPVAQRFHPPGKFAVHQLAILFQAPQRLLGPLQAGGANVPRIPSRYLPRPWKSTFPHPAACRGPHADRASKSPPPRQPNRAESPSLRPSKTDHRARTAHSLRPPAALPRLGSAMHRESA